jgi:hypothetical protein
MYTDAELLAIPPIAVGPDHFRNPFADVSNDPFGAALAKRWGDLHWGQKNAVATDPLAALLVDLSFVDSGFQRHEHPETGATVFFPSLPVLKGAAQRAADDEWEQRSVAMHESQQGIELAKMPTPNGLQRPGIARGD